MKMPHITTAIVIAFAAGALAGYYFNKMKASMTSLTTSTSTAGAGAPAATTTPSTT